MSKLSLFSFSGIFIAYEASRGSTSHFPSASTVTSFAAKETSLGIIMSKLRVDNSDSNTYRRPNEESRILDDMTQTEKLAF